MIGATVFVAHTDFVRKGERDAEAPAHADRAAAGRVGRQYRHRRFVTSGVEAELSRKSRW
jgi:hypothetical protein